MIAAVAAAAPAAAEAPNVAIDVAAAAGAALAAIVAMAAVVVAVVAARDVDAKICWAMSSARKADVLRASSCIMKLPKSVATRFIKLGVFLFNLFVEIGALLVQLAKLQAKFLGCEQSAVVAFA